MLSCTTLTYTGTRRQSGYIKSQLHIHNVGHCGATIHPDLSNHGTLARLVGAP